MVAGDHSHELGAGAQPLRELDVLRRRCATSSKSRIPPAALLAADLREGFLHERQGECAGRVRKAGELTGTEGVSFSVVTGSEIPVA
jgi:hypothetical protein